MSGVKRYDVLGDFDGGYIDEADDGRVVLFDDYAALEADRSKCWEEFKLLRRVADKAEAERDELRARFEAMRQLLVDARRYVDKAWPDGVHSYRANSVSGDLLSKIDAALQAKR